MGSIVKVDNNEWLVAKEIKTCFLPLFVVAFKNDNLKENNGFPVNIIIVSFKLNNNNLPVADNLRDEQLSLLVEKYSNEILNIFNLQDKVGGKKFPSTT